MDIENLSKTDLIITAFFLCFVTAIVTGIVMIFLFEDAPEDIIRVSERIVSEESTSTDQVNTSNGGMSDQPSATSPVVEDNPNKSRDTILNTSVGAVARITSDNTAPQAGVLLNTPTREVIITSSADFSTTSRALFENGVVMNLAAVESIDPSFSRLMVEEASGQVTPLPIATEIPEVGESLFVVPLSQQPQIVTVTVTQVSGNAVETSARSLPPVSLLLNYSGEVVGLYNPTTGSFKTTTAITGQ